MFQIIKLYFRSFLYNRSALLLLISGLFSLAIMWANYDAQLGKYRLLIACLFISVSFINPPAIQTIRGYFRVKKRMQKTKCRGSIKYIKSETGTCYQAGARMALEDLGRSLLKKA